jgi:hypothetical protein
VVLGLVFGKQAFAAGDCFFFKNLPVPTPQIWMQGEGPVKNDPAFVRMTDILSVSFLLCRGCDGPPLYLKGKVQKFRKKKVSTFEDDSALSRVGGHCVKPKLPTLPMIVPVALHKNFS